MLRNLLTESDLRAYIPNIDLVQWTGTSDYSAQIEAAEREVRDDLYSVMGLKSSALRPELTLNAGTSSITSSTTSDSVEDAADRKRLVCNVTAFSGTSHTVTLQGSNDESTWTTVTTLTITETGIETALLPAQFTYYKATVAVSSGAMTANIYLTETIYDTLFAYKTLAIILQALIKTDGDQWSIKASYFHTMYEKKLATYKMFYDANLDGEVDEGELISNTIIKYNK